MQILIGLFRGINVGGKNIVPMKALKEAMEAEGFVDVQTYIQSGNVLFCSPLKSLSKIEAKLSGIVESHFGFAPKVMVRTLAQIEKAVSANPFADAVTLPNRMVITFLTQEPKNPNLEWFESVRDATESFELIGDIAYLYAPETLADSKIAARMESILKVSGTGRNLNTLKKLIDLASK